MISDSGSPPAGGELVAPLPAGQNVGKIAGLSGQVMVERANIFIAHPSLGELTFEGDILRTGQDGEVSAQFVDGTYVALTPDESIVLEGFAYEPHNIAGSVSFRALKGHFAFFGGEIAKRGRFIVHTPKAQIRNTGAAGFGVFAFAFFWRWLTRLAPTAKK